MAEIESVRVPGGEAKDEKLELEPTQGKTKDVTVERDGGVLKEILRAGSGDDQPLKGDTVYVHYTGKLTDGTTFDASKKEKFQFVVGKGDVIKAWEIGVPTMKKGEQARFWCKPKYAYGKKGSPPKIPPNATLIFDIELFSWRGEDVSENKDGGVLKSRVKDGDSGNPPKDGAVCKIRVIGKHNGRQFLERDFRLTLGEGSEFGVVDGIEQALRTMKSSERALLKIKSRYAYGAEGNEKYGIPPNADVEFDVDLMSYDPFKEGWMMDDEDEKLSAAKTMKLKGTKYFQEGKYKFAVKYYSRIIEFLQEEDQLRGDRAKLRTSLMLAAHLNIAACHLKLDSNLEASHACDEALKLDPENEKGLYRRATARMNIQNYEAAIEDYKALLVINSQNKLAKDQIAAANQKLQEIRQQEKNIYSKMFQKKPHTGELKVWKEKRVEVKRNTEGEAAEDEIKESRTDAAESDTNDHKEHLTKSAEDLVINGQDDDNTSEDATTATSCTDNDHVSANNRDSESLVTI